MTRIQSKSELTESVKKEVNRYFGGSLRVQDWDELVQEGYLEEIFVNPDTRSRVGAWGGDACIALGGKMLP